MENNTEIYNAAVDTLAKFGNAFQVKAISALLSSSKFLIQSHDILNPYFFDSSALQWVVKFILKYHGEYKSAPTMEVFAAEVKKMEVTDEILSTSIKELLRDVYKRVNSDTDLEYVRDQLLGFCQNQTLKSAIIKSVDLLQAGRYPEIKSVIDVAMRAGHARDIGHDYVDDMDARLLHAPRNTISTGWAVVDGIMDGGLAPGELGVIAAPSSVGKSWALSTIGSSAMKSGLTVIHYTLELNEHYVGIRYDTIFTGIEPASVRAHYQEVQTKIASIPGRIIIKYYPAKGATIHTIQAHIEELKMNDILPDLVIVDYADLLRGTAKTENRYQELGAIYEELRGVAGELMVPIWTASQTQRCLTLDTIVQTVDGEIPIGTLKIGDEIKTHEGYKKVVNIFPVQQQPVYEITLKSGKKIKCSINHEFPTADNKLLSISTGLGIGHVLLTEKIAQVLTNQRLNI